MNGNFYGPNPRMAGNRPGGNFYRMPPQQSFGRDQLSYTTFPEQIGHLNKLLESLAKSKDPIKTKKTLFQNGLTKMIFYWNVETDANRVLLFRLLFSFLKYFKSFLDPKWLTPLLDKLESKSSIDSFPGDSKEEILVLSERLRSQISQNTSKMHVAGKASFWIEKAKKNRKSLQNAKKWISAYFQRTMISKEKLSFMDPFSMTRIRLPVRGKSCEHLQVFDLETFVRRWFSPGAPKGVGAMWLCPICAAQTHPRALFVDSFVQEMIQRHPSRDEVLLDEAASVVDTAKKSEDVIEFDSSDDDAGCPPPVPPRRSAAEDAQPRFEPPPSRSVLQRPPASVPPRGSQLRIPPAPPRVPAKPVHPPICPARPSLRGARLPPRAPPPPRSAQEIICLSGEEGTSDGRESSDDSAERELDDDSAKDCLETYNEFVQKRKEDTAKKTKTPNVVERRGKKRLKRKLPENTCSTRRGF